MRVQGALELDWGLVNEGLSLLVARAPIHDLALGVRHPIFRCEELQKVTMSENESASDLSKQQDLAHMVEAITQADRHPFG
jgi:hypothetical protein